MSGSLLAIELSTTQGSVAVSQDGELVFESVFESKRSHNSQLFGPLQQALAEARDLTAVVVGTGPGSYTGVRIGIAAAQGVALSRSVPVAGLSSLTALDCGDDYVVVGDARRGQLYLAKVVAGRLESGIEVFPAEKWPEKHTELQGTALCCCDPRLPAAVAGASVSLIQPSARGLLARVQGWGEDDWKAAATLELQPIYLQEAFITRPTRNAPRR